MLQKSPNHVLFYATPLLACVSIGLFVITPLLVCVSICTAAMMIAGVQ